VLYWALILLVVALLFGSASSWNVANVALEMTRVVFFIFLLLFVVGLVASLNAA
jgi:uncharacterized membrane protein YtjA (UPF0391 family)